MKITIVGRQMNVWDEMKSLIEAKLSKLEKYFNDEGEATVTLSSKHNQKCLEITILYGGTIFRSEVQEETFRNALDKAIYVIERQIRKNKTRLEKMMKKGAFVIEDDDDDEFEEEEEFCIRTKSYPKKPMTPQEAILQMNLLGHAFFVFYDDEISETCVVYKRKDGGYGLIIPEK